MLTTRLSHRVITSCSFNEFQVAHFQRIGNRSFAAEERNAHHHQTDPSGAGIVDIKPGYSVNRRTTADVTEEKPLIASPRPRTGMTTETARQRQ